MEFTLNGKKMLLRGAKNPTVKLITNEGLNSAVSHGAELSFLQIEQSTPQLIIPECSVHHEGNSTPTTPHEISLLMEQYQSIFDEPRLLPPARLGFDHKIPLKEGTPAVNLRPYRYSIIQKDIVDNLVGEMLKQGIIQHSNSPFASPTVLVRKKDGSWRLCVDYRRLNHYTVKDRFPIPLIEDLMDELGGAAIFSMLDLRSGYHQVRMDLGEEHKTSFKTHCGHFEYLVMPFGLANAPATFQALMNHVFHTFLRKFVIIFFDDILVYSKTFDEHVEHLSLIFDTIKTEQLYLNRSKCQFATSKVE